MAVDVFDSLVETRVSVETTCPSMLFLYIRLFFAYFQLFRRISKADQILKLKMLRGGDIYVISHFHVSPATQFEPVTRAVMIEFMDGTSVVKSNAAETKIYVNSDHPNVQVYICRELDQQPKS